MAVLPRVAANATQRYLYRSKLDGSDTPERVTPADQPGYHTYDLAPGGRLAFHTLVAFDRATGDGRHRAAIASHTAALTDTTALTTALAPVIKVPTEFVSVDVGNGVTLDGWMMKPPSFDPSRNIPVIVYVYGEVADQTVKDRWASGRQLFHRALAEAGYIVVSFDNRGTPAPKGAAWRHVVYGIVGDLVIEGARGGDPRAGGEVAVRRRQSRRASGVGAAAARTR